MTQLYQDELAQLYDVAVPDWPGEIAFYSHLVQQMPAEHPSILEIACGTGRVTVQLADLGHQIVGIDLSDEMLAFARTKSRQLANVRWVTADMRSFELAEAFGLAIVPAYSFQLLLTKTDQAACLRQIARHLQPGARLVLHLEKQDPDWLASLPQSEFAPFEASGEATHPGTGQRIRVSYAWSYNMTEHYVAVVIRYEVIGDSGEVVSGVDRGPLRMHCTSHDHLQEQFEAVGFAPEAIYGDFRGQPCNSDSEETIWIVRKA